MASTPDAALGPVVVVGAGRVGKALAQALSLRGVATRVVTKRGFGAFDFARASCVVIAVRDPQIAGVSASLAPRIAPRTVVLHCAGRLDPDVLAACRARGAATGQFHPLLSFAGRVPDFRGATILVRGDARAVRVARGLARALGAVPRTLAGLDAGSYHAGAAIFANGLVALAGIYARILATGGLSVRQAMELAGPLGTSVLQNLSALGPERALTGPVRRGDARATRALVQVARGVGDDALLAVRGLAAAQILLASASGELDDEALSALRRAVGQPTGRRRSTR